MLSQHFRENKNSDKNRKNEDEQSSLITENEKAKIINKNKKLAKTLNTQIKPTHIMK